VVLGVQYCFYLKAREEVNTFLGKFFSNFSTIRRMARMRQLPDE